MSAPGYPVTAYPVSGYPAPAYPVGYPPAPVAASVATMSGLARVERVEGTPFGVMFPAIAPTRSGPSIGSLVVGIASILVSFAVGCFGLAGGTGGWGVTVSGAFLILGVFVGAGSIWLGIYGLRQIRRAGGAIAGRGLAVAGLSCGGVGLGLTLAGFLVAILFSVGQ